MMAAARAFAFSPLPPIPRALARRRQCACRAAGALIAAALGVHCATAQDLASLPAVDAARLQELQHAEREGLASADYGVELLLGMAVDPSPATRDGFTRALDQAYRQYASDLAHGRASPLLADPDWHIPTQRDLPTDDQDGSAATAAAAPPPHPQYAQLRQALNAYQAIERAGGWPAIPAGPELRFGDRDERVAAVRDRLRLSGDYGREMQADPWFFDTGIDEALRRFQVRHGIPATGVLDERSRDAANVTVAQRIAQLEVTLERWRWLPPDVGSRYVWVNTASTTLQVVANGHPVLAMKTIVGHPGRPTPSLRSELRQIVFNPTWSVPRTIAVEDLLPRQQDDNGYLARHRIRVLSGSGTAEQQIDPAAIAWDRLGPDYFPYRLRQDAGPGNSLGRVKLVMDNPFDIYLHDTPERGLFDLSSRTLGSGCVRLENAAALATLILAEDRPWTAADTAARIAGQDTMPIDLQRRLPIYIVYLTAWIDAANAVNFRRDVYGRDARALAALRQPRGLTIPVATLPAHRDAAFRP